MPLTAPQTDNKYRGRQQVAFPVKNGVTIYPGALVGIETTPGSARGRLIPWDDTSANLTMLFMGIAQPTAPAAGVTATDGSVTGNAAGTRTMFVDISGVIIEDVPVAGVTSQVNGGSSVFATGDDYQADLTLTSNNQGRIGRILRFLTGTRVDVLLHTPGEAGVI